MTRQADSADPRATEHLRDDQSGVRVQRFAVRVVDGPDAGAEARTDGGTIVVGTHERVDLCLTDRAVSRLHLEIASTPRGPVLRDLESTNGTLVDGVAVTAAPLARAATITIGRTRLAFAVESDEARIEVLGAQRFGLLAGRSLAMRRIFGHLAAAAPTDSTVLLFGETGTGKELAAESIHRESPRANGPFVVVDCGAIPATLLDSELFGHVRGAFTGAVASRTGAFELASGGTLFLDEIGELAPELQPKLLRALERRMIKPVGSDKWIPVDVRVVAATNRDLRPQVNAQTFRADLYYRLAVVVVTLPALRERADDLPLLIDAILANLGQAARPEAELLRSPQVLEELRRHAWSGNVRELRNYVEMCLAIHAAPAPERTAAQPADVIDHAAPFYEGRDRWLARFERPYLTELLRRHDGNVAAAARGAGLDRTYLYKLLAKHGLK